MIEDLQTQMSGITVTAYNACQHIHYEMVACAAVESTKRNNIASFHEGLHIIKYAGRMALESYTTNSFSPFAANPSTYSIVHECRIPDQNMFGRYPPNHSLHRAAAFYYLHGHLGTVGHSQARIAH